MSKLLSEWNTCVLKKEHKNHEVSQKTTKLSLKLEIFCINSLPSPFAFLSFLALQDPCSTGYLFKLVEVFVN